MIINMAWESELGVEIVDMTAPSALWPTGAPGTKAPEILGGGIFEINKIRKAKATGENQYGHHYIYGTVGIHKRGSLESIGQRGEATIAEARHRVEDGKEHPIRRILEHSLGDGKVYSHRSNRFYNKSEAQYVHHHRRESTHTFGIDKIAYEQLIVDT